MRIADMNWMQVEQRVRGDDRCVLPIGSVEQHAYLSLCVDMILSEKVAVDAAAPLGVPVYPAVPFGITPYFADFPGTVSLRLETYHRIVTDIVDSLSGAGFTRILFVNGHGGNIATVTAAFSEIYADRSMEKLSNQPSVKCALRNWWDGAGIRQLQKELYPSGEGSHATASEVALTWYKYPETMNRTQLEPRIAPNGSFADAEDYRRAFPDGRIGSDPSQATPEHGKRFYDTAVEEVARDYERWVAR